MADREQTIKRIRAFLARAADGASTESEQIKAAQRAAKLMDQHGISSAEIEDANALGGYNGAVIHVTTVWQQPIYTGIAVAIANFTGTYAFVQRRKGRKVPKDIRINFYGELADVLFAEWLAKSIADFVIAGCEAETADKHWSRKDLNDYRFGYLVAASMRINTRIAELLAERNVNRVASKLPALVDKSTAAKNALMATGAKLTAGLPNKPREVPREAIDKGTDRANAVSFAKGVGDTQPVGLLG